MSTENKTGRYRPPGPLGCGGAPLGNLFARVDEDEAQAVLELAWNNDVRHFDTAPFYGFGLSEHRFGQALRNRPRDSFMLSTKVGRILEPAPNAALAEERFSFVGGLPFEVHFDYSADAARRSIEDSLQRLGLARIDVVYIHDVGEDTHGPDWEARFEEAMKGAAPALTRLREEGVIRAWGLGVNRVEPCLRALERADPDVFLAAGRYTLLDTASLDTLLPRCGERDVSIVVGGPYNSGLLTGGNTYDYVQAPPALIARRDAMAALCQRHGVDLRAAALQFCTAHPAVAAAIPGARTVAEMRQNVALMTQPIPQALWTELKREGLIPDHAPVPA
jgi:D-threo-aldose 1-dehydrogenase